MRCSYSLYMYDIEEAFRDPTYLASDSLLHNTTSFQHGIELVSLGQFALGWVFYHRASQSVCRTWNASEATLFFIPAFSARFFQGHTSVGAAKLADALARVRIGATSALQRFNGRDHFIVQPRNGASYERRPYRELNYADHRLLHTTRLSIESPGTNYSSYRAESIYDGVPFPSQVRRGTPWQSRHTRYYLLAVSLRVHGRAARVRRELQHTCAHESACSLGPPSHAFQQYWNATFCAQPPGDAISRKGVVDALLVGCIPILFHPQQRGQWPWHLSDWIDDASVLVTNVSRLISTLRAIDSVTVAKMRQTIAERAHRLVYREVDETDDAFDRTLTHLAARRSSFAT